MPRLFLFPVGLAVLLAMSSTAHATTANDLCSASANPCLITGDNSLTPGSVLDVGTRALQVRPTGRLRVPSGSTLQITAGSLRIEAGDLGFAVRQDGGILHLKRHGGAPPGADGP